MSFPIDVDGTGYVDAVAQFASANHGVVDAINTLTDTLYQCGGMAGNDTGGQSFAEQYDPAAAQLVSGGCQLGDALASMANLLNGSLANHDGAEHGAQMYPGEPDAASGDTNPAHGTESLIAPAPPSAMGGIGGEPGWWHWIASHLGGLLWPDADTGKLRSAGGAWTTAASTISAQQYAIDAASSAIATQTSPEVADVIAACTEMRGHVTDFADACQAVGDACTQYAQSVDDHHKEIEDELKSFIEWTAAIEIGGGILGALTFGIGEAAAQIGEGAEVANAAEKVIVILNDLIKAAEGFVDLIRVKVAKIGEVLAKLRKFLSAKVISALERLAPKIAEDLKGVESVADDPVADALYGEPRPGGESPEIPGRPDDPSGYDHVTDPDAPYGRLPDGQPMTKAEYDARYTAPDGSVRWPNNQGAVDGSRIRYSDPQAYVERYGNRVDRIGDDGGYLGVMRDGKPDPFEARSLPADNVAKPYHSYTLHPENLPDGWSIETGEIAPAFGREGGGEQMFIANAEGRRVPVSVLMEKEILR